MSTFKYTAPLSIEHFDSRATEDVRAIRAQLLPKHHARALPPPEAYPEATKIWRTAHRGQQKAANAANAWRKRFSHDDLTLLLREGFYLWGGPASVLNEPWPLQTEILCDRRFVRRLEEGHPMFRQRDRKFCWHDARYLGFTVDMLIAPLLDRPPEIGHVLALFDVIHAYMTPILHHQWKTANIAPERFDERTAAALPPSPAPVAAATGSAGASADTTDSVWVQDLLEKILSERDAADKPRVTGDATEDKHSVTRQYTRTVLRLLMVVPDSSFMSTLTKAPPPLPRHTGSPGLHGFVGLADQFVAQFQPASRLELLGNGTTKAADPELFWVATGELNQIATQCIAHMRSLSDPRERQLAQNVAQAVMTIASVMLHKPTP